LLWTGAASESSGPRGANSPDLMGVVMLVVSAVNQVMSEVQDKSHKVAGVATTRLLSAGAEKGLLFGPRSPKYDKR